MVFYSIMANCLSEVKTWMKSRNIIAPGDWLEACLNWVVEENREGSLSMSRIKQCIYEQWLLADLQEIGSSCLPDDVFSNEKSTLAGIYALQMLYIHDISQPCYSQLLKLHGKNNENARVSAEPQLPTQPWELKPKRMMMMTVTDGSRSLQAMEYKPIASLHIGLPAGTKILICGPIDCRLGILLLTAENIQILGGEVESKVLENSNEKVLLRMLGQNDNAVEDRYCHNREEPQSVDSGIASNTNSGMHYVQNEMNSANLEQWNSLQPTPRNCSLLHRTTNHKGMINLSNNRIDSTVSDVPDSSSKINGADEFEDDDEFLSNLDYDHLDQLVQECSGTPSEKGGNESAVNSSSCKIRTPPPTLLDIPDWDLDDFA